MSKITITAGVSKNYAVIHNSNILEFVTITEVFNYLKGNVKKPYQVSFEK